VACGGISLANKHQIASFSEVFLNPHYWRLFDLLSAPPKIIVDLGGNCGFFPVLCEIVAQSRFGDCVAEYHVFEAVDAMTQNIAFVAREAKIDERMTIVRGAIGKRSGQAIFASGPKSLLDSSAVYEGKERRFRQRIDYIDLENYFEERRISQLDVLKIDIEGSEYDLIETFPQLFKKVSLIFIELHDVRGDGSQLIEARQFFKSSGLAIVEPIIQSGPHQLLVLSRAKS
jgi:FkbM family methyltransferase